MNKYFKVYSLTLLLGADFNGHHCLWRSAQSNNTEIALVEAIDSYPGLVVRNERHVSRLTATCKNISAVDPAILSANLRNESYWSIIKDAYGSDHFPVLNELIMKEKNRRKNYFVQMVN